MASLYVKSPKAADLAERAARLQGKTKTGAVIDALQDVVDRLEPSTSKRPSMREWVLEYRRLHPLRPTGFVADKAFYDSLNDEDDD